MTFGHFRFVSLAVVAACAHRQPPPLATLSPVASKNAPAVAPAPALGHENQGAWLRFDSERGDAVAMRFPDGRMQVAALSWSARSGTTLLATLMPPVDIPTAQVDLRCSTYGCTALGAQGELRSIAFGRAATPISNRRPGAVALGSLGMGDCELVAGAVQCHSTDNALAQRYNALGEVAAFVPATSCVQMVDKRVMCPADRGGVTELWHAALQVSLLERYGGYDGCAVLPNQTVECINAQAILLGAVVGPAAPPRVRVPGLDHIDEVQVSKSRSCVRRRGEVYCWGDGRVVALPYVHDAVAIAVTSAATCVLHASHTLSCSLAGAAPVVVAAAPRVTPPQQPCWSGGEIASNADPALQLPPLVSLARYPLKFKMFTYEEKQARAKMLQQRVPGLAFSIGDIGEVSGVATSVPPCTLLARTDRDEPTGDVKGADVDQWRAALARALPDVPGLVSDAYATTFATTNENVQVLGLKLFNATSVVYYHDVPGPVAALLPPRATDDTLLQRWQQGQLAAVRVVRTVRIETPPHQCERADPEGHPCDPFSRDIVTVKRRRIGARPLAPYLVGKPRFEFAVERRGNFLLVRQLARISIDNLRFERDLARGTQGVSINEIAPNPEVLDAVTAAPFKYPK
jgi:hypothetical protein